MKWILSVVVHSIETKDMASKEGKAVILPALNPKVNYRGFPRRYEETKPAVVQDFTHRSILRKSLFVIVSVI